MRDFSIPVVSGDKSCGECTACCDGWLKGNIYGHEMKPGIPCKYRIEKKGCSIYENRPEKPCKKFNCEWKKLDDWPDFLRPDKCGVIVKLFEENGHWFFSARETGQKMDSYILSCLIQYCKQNNRNLYYEIQERWWAIGTPEFENYVRSKE